jgi:hypothetical protein
VLKIGQFKFINFDKSFGIVVVVEAQALHSPNSVIDHIKDCRGECFAPTDIVGRCLRLATRFSLAKCDQSFVGKRDGRGAAAS